MLSLSEPIIEEEDSMTEIKSPSKFYAEYDLMLRRQENHQKQPALHQNVALGKLRQWYENGSKQDRGGILVLPTGGGKTFTAVHFACSLPLSDGFKVLWLAHTHHLLEQAFDSFATGASLVTEPRPRLHVRVVSGMEEEHFPVHTIRPTDDVVISSLPMACRAIKNEHEAMAAFLNSSQGKLLIIFDEAHHAPAPSHRELLRELRKRFPGMYLLGLTATPTYGDARKRGWLIELFPQGIVHQVTAAELMAVGILAKPVLHEEQTSFTPDFNDREYRKWLGTYRDIPEDIVNTLALNKERNDYITGAYVAQREKWGKTIIFADRWYQCDYLREALLQRGVRADVVYAHVDADPGSAEARNRRKADENTHVLQSFKDNKLDVLINVKMLTEGTDIPDVQTVFLTRQTTSRILVTQMVGRALRGPRFGGTPEAHIVSFIDNWKQHIDWAAYDQLTVGEVDDEIRELRKRPPVHLISIELVRRLARQMDSGSNINPGPYRQFLPIGWYLVEYMTRVAGSDDEVSVQQQVMVFEHNKDKYETFLAALSDTDLMVWQEYELSFETVRDQIETWQNSYFAEGVDHIGSDLQRDMFAMGRHMAQNDKQFPRFIPFDAHKLHDLDQVAHGHLENNLGALQIYDQLRKEYSRKDRCWSVFYPSYDMFKSQYDGCVNRLIKELTGTGSADLSSGVSNPEPVPEPEPDEEVKRQVKQRDGRRCLCCGASRPLQVDHIKPRYLGGTNDSDNLQTLCRSCNQDKGIKSIDFRKKKTPLKEAPSHLLETSMPSIDLVRDIRQWEMFVRATFNLFYRCTAVDTVEIGQRGEKFHHWRVTLLPGNKSDWILPHLVSLVAYIRKAREEAGLAPAPQKIMVQDCR